MIIKQDIKLLSIVSFTIDSLVGLNTKNALMILKSLVKGVNVGILR